MKKKGWIELKTLKTIFELKRWHSLMTSKSFEKRPRQSQKTFNDSIMRWNQTWCSRFKRQKQRFKIERELWKTKTKKFKTSLFKQMQRESRKKMRLINSRSKLTRWVQTLLKCWSKPLPKCRIELKLQTSSGTEMMELRNNYEKSLRSLKSNRRKEGNSPSNRDSRV